jgi:hypothetical protein
VKSGAAVAVACMAAVIAETMAEKLRVLAMDSPSENEKGAWEGVLFEFSTLYIAHGRIGYSASVVTG